MTKMEEMNFRKMKCSQGHWSGVYPVGENIPGSCPVCGQPYDRRRNRPVMCLADGTIPGENADSGEKDTPSVEEKPARVINRQENESAESVESITTNRRRTGEIPQRNTPPVAGTRRRRIENIQEQPVVQSNEPTGHFYVRTGDEKIEIAPQGESIGRIGSFAKMCMLNPLISRNHAMLIPDSRRGTVTIADENSLNGTSVDDGQGRRKLNRDESAVLHPGDRFWLADELFMIEGDK